MRGAAAITMAAGGALIAAAWVLGGLEVVIDHREITDLLAPALAVPIVPLAWRYRRHRLAVAAATVAGASLLVTGDPPAVAARDPLTVLGVFVVADLAVLAFGRDHPLFRLPSAAWIVVIAVQTWLIVAAPPTITALLDRLDEQPAAPVAAYAAAGAVTAAAFALRRGAFEASLVWTSVGGAVAFAIWRGPQPTTLLLAAGELTLLVGFFEDAYRLAFHDELTGLPGRRAFDDAMRGLGGLFTIAMVDIDHFKRFNDRYGHAAGDQVLRMVADELGKVGGGGRAHRWGGEEFAILFPGGEPSGVRGHLEELRTAIDERSFALRGPDRPKTRPEKPAKRSPAAKRVNVQVSIGFAGTQPRRTTASAVLKAADRALYRAKRAGRNRVVGAGDRLPKRG